MASKLALYNASLTKHLGERKLASLSENRAPRRRLDTVWDAGGVTACLEAGAWNFAMRSISLTYSPSVTPAFGYTYAFDHPSDWVSTFLVSNDESFANLEVDYVDEGSYWYGHDETLYVKYVSSDVAYGLDLSRWTQSFTEYAEAYFAHAICKATTGSQSETDALEATRDKLLRIARSRDAMNEQVRKPPSGSWARARGGSRNAERGNRGRLIG